MFHPLGMAAVLEGYILVFSFPPSGILASEAGKEFSEYLPRLWHEGSGVEGGKDKCRVPGPGDWSHFQELPEATFLDIFLGCWAPRGSGQDSS